MSTPGADGLYLELARALSTAPNLVFGLGRALEVLADSLTARQAALYARGPGRSLLVREAYCCRFGRRNAPARVRVGEGLFGGVAARGLSGRVRWQAEDWACVPLYLGSTLVGMIVLSQKSARDVSLLRRLSVVGGFIAPAMGLHAARVAEQRMSRAKETQLQAELQRVVGVRAMIGESAPVRRLKATIAQVAPSSIPVLISGESGTGKELVATLIHDLSDRREGPMVTVNGAALTETLAESELFGHAKGAFTGATERKPGLFARAHGGTLFLDEVGDLPASVQPKLLRVLQERLYEEVGGTASLKADVRLLAATNCDLESDVKAGRFRKDLFYRLNGFPIRVPTLRERREDVPALALHFLKRYAAESGRPAREFDPDAMLALTGHSWPGNIRELQNAVNRAVLICPGKTVGPEHLPAELQESGSALPGVGPGGEAGFKGAVGRLEKDLVEAALSEAGGRRDEAARRLGLSLRSVRYLIRKHAILAHSFKSPAPKRLIP